MAIIVTNTNWVQIDGNRLQKGSRDLHPIKNGVRLTVPGGSDNWDILVDDTTIDGVAVSDSAELMAFFEAQGFRNGGGAPSEGVQSVTGDLVDNTDPINPIVDLPDNVVTRNPNGNIDTGIPDFPENAVPLALLNVRAPNLEEGNFLVGGEDGNEQRKVLPSDIGYIGGPGLRLVSILDGVIHVPIIASNATTGGTITTRTSTGQGKFNPAINADEAVVLSQFQGIPNNTLTDQETSITLNALYPNIAIGTVVTAGTAGMEYRKVDIDTWTKKPIEII